MKKRVISAILMIALFIPVVIIGGITFDIFATILGILSLYEMMRLEKNIPMFLKIFSYLVCIFVMISKYIGYNDIIDYRIFGVLFLVYSCSFIAYGKLDKYSYRDAFWLMFVTILIGVLYNNLINLRELGIVTVFYIFLIPICTDTFALYSGKLFGKHKLTPISPNKTIEGSIGGAIIGTIIPVCYLFFSNNMTFGLISTIFITFGLSILGQFGDLFFSAIKRHYGIKDYSNLIPGHGGILDRMDSTLFVVLGYLVLMMFI